MLYQKKKKKETENQQENQNKKICFYLKQCYINVLIYSLKRVAHGAHEIDSRVAQIAEQAVEACDAPPVHPLFAGEPQSAVRTGRKRDLPRQMRIERCAEDDDLVH